MKYHRRSCVCNCCNYLFLFLLTLAVVFRNSSGFSTGCGKQLHQQQRRRRILENNNNIINGNSNVIILGAASEKSKESWSIGDDWDSLSSENPANTIPDSNDIYNQDITLNAASSMMDKDAKKYYEIMSDDELYVHDAIETIQGGLIPVSPNNVKLYDSKLISDKGGHDTTTSTVIATEDEMGNEIAMLVRCNENPEEMLIEGGRALPPLTKEQKNDISQLIVQDVETDQLQATSFLREAVSTIFQKHAICDNDHENENDEEDQDSSPVGEKNNNDKLYYMDARCVGKWIQQSLQLQQEIGPHDRRVTSIVSQYSTYGTGKIYEEDLQNLYLKTILGPKKTPTLVDLMRRRPKMIDGVFTDIRNHNILSPIEQERNNKLQQIQQKQQQQQQALLSGTTTSSNSNNNNKDFMDECEILEWDIQSSESNILRKSSYENVQVCVSDNETPVHMKDGEFVFIDEESCIGCNQCVSVSPESFVMLENGRVRTYEQRNTPDVIQAVQSCPVNCMHYMSFKELKKFESARDYGDGRTDHRHFSTSTGTDIAKSLKSSSRGNHGNIIAHTPLHVAGIDSDANRKSSWYHYLRNKCYVSKACPQAGCYDCPFYNTPGQNPHFQKKMKNAQHIRAQHFIQTGIADKYRKTADL